LLDVLEDAGYVRHRKAHRHAARALSPDCVRASVPGGGIARSGIGARAARIQIIPRSLEGID
jgi:hypothetical protein